MSKAVLVFTIAVLHSCYLLRADVANTTQPLRVKLTGLPQPLQNAAPPPSNPGCLLPPPPPPPAVGCPIPQRSESEKVLRATQELGKIISYDPNGYTKTWNGDDYCTYRGYYCEDVPDRNLKGLAGVDFNGANFGSSPTTTLDLGGYILNLPDIAIFHANSNNLTGPVPLNISSLRFLYELDLSNNRFTGDFPQAVLGATNLTFLDIRYNSFCGPIPAQLFKLDLDVLFLNNNKFSQPIPDNLGDTPVLYLTFANNFFSGPIPRSIGSAPNLLEVLFLNNQLDGCLPYEIGLLNRTTVFDVGSNQLTGPIPQSFACLEKMEELNLAHNQLYGAVPENVCKLQNLYNFTASFNYFTQVGPHCRELIERKVLNVTMNCILDLPEQRSAEECTAFFTQRRYCPFPETFSIVPCNVPPSTHNSPELVRSKRAKASSPTYAALHKKYP